jgi:hypothetical protein
LPSSIVKTIWLEGPPCAERSGPSAWSWTPSSQGPNEYDADNIAKVVERRPRPTYEERVAMFLPTGRAGAVEGTVR